MNQELSTYCELFWWNFGKKTTSYKGDLRGLLKENNIKFSTRNSKEVQGLRDFYFKSAYGLSWKVRGTTFDFKHFAKQFIQMELVRMGDKSKLYVQGCPRPTVSVNF